MYGYIYKFTLIPTGKIYVGKRKSTKFDSYYYGSGRKWMPLVEEYGKGNVKREVLEWCETEQELNEREKYWIKELDSRNPEVGYNISAGGHNPVLCGESNPRYGKPIAEGTKEKQRLAAKRRKENGWKRPEVTEETRLKLSNASLGHEVSKEVRRKLREANLGKIHITDGVCNKSIYKSELEEYRLKGFELGVTKKNNIKKIWVTNGVINKSIPYSDIDKYAENGFIRGRTRDKEKVKLAHDKAKITLANLSDEEKQRRHLEASKRYSGINNPMYGSRYRWMTNGINDVRADYAKVDYYLNIGYRLGRTKAHGAC